MGASGLVTAGAFGWIFALVAPAGLALETPGALDGAPAALPAISPDRFLPRSPGSVVNLTLSYGPFPVPPGENSNRVTVDLVPHDGFLTDFAVRLKDARTGDAPPHDRIHLHHAHWLRHASDPARISYPPGLEWVFGTGEEATRGDVDARADAEPEGPRYGIEVHGGEPHVLVYMVHNFGRDTLLLDLEVETRFVHGTANAIRAASSCESPLGAASACLAGEDFHPLLGWLWGDVFDVRRDASGPGKHVHSPDAEPRMGFTAPWSGTVIGIAGHLHENGETVVVANLGPAGSGCEADLDGDGFPGETLFRSRKVDARPEAWPHSRDFAMEATVPAFRAPVRAGDRLAQYAVYENAKQATFEAMSFVGLYADLEQVPPPRPKDDGAGAAACAAGHAAPWLAAGAVGDPRVGALTHAGGMGGHGDHSSGSYCDPPFAEPCDEPERDRPAGRETSRVRILDFTFVPGDRSLDGPDGALPKVPAGGTLEFLNLDAARHIRHAVTSCKWPCNGPARMNYPRADDVFHSGLLGNLDPLDGAPDDGTASSWTLSADLAPGRYSYYCRMHPWMRGAFEIEGDASAPQAPAPESAAPPPAPALETSSPGLAGALAVAAALARVRARRRAPPGADASS